MDFINLIKNNWIQISLVIVLVFIVVYLVKYLNKIKSIPDKSNRDNDNVNASDNPNILKITNIDTNSEKNNSDTNTNKDTINEKNNADSNNVKDNTITDTVKDNTINETINDNANLNQSGTGLVEVKDNSNSNSNVALDLELNKNPIITVSDSNSNSDLSIINEKQDDNIIIFNMNDYIISDQLFDLQDAYNEIISVHKSSTIPYKSNTISIIEEIYNDDNNNVSGGVSDNHNDNNITLNDNDKVKVKPILKNKPKINLKSNK